MKRLLFIILCVMLTVAAAAQIRVTGRVMNLQNKPVSDVIVKLVKANKTLAFTSTNAKGEYALELKELREQNHARLNTGESQLNRTETQLKSVPGGEVSLQFSHIGYEKELETISLNEKVTKVDMVLTPKDINLKEVTVKAPPLFQQGDTLTYNLASFLRKGDVTLEDGLKNLPGIDISDNGAISYMGKSISNFYIGGLDMLGGRYNLATKNIPAEYATQVDIMKHHKHRKIDADEESDAVAINIKLSKKAQFKPFGQPELGIGIREDDVLYAAGATGMMFADSFQLIASAKYGNNGNFGLHDMVNHSGGDNFSSLATDKLPAWGQAGSSVGESVYRTNAYGSINGILKIDSVRQLRVNADYTYERMNSSATSEAYYYAGGDNIYISESVNPLAKAHRPMLNIKFENNASNHYFSETFSARAQFLSNDCPTLTLSEGDDAVLNTQHRDATAINLSNKLWATIRKGKKKLSFTSNINFIRTPEVQMLMHGSNSEQGSEIYDHVVMNEDESTISQSGQSTQLNTSHSTSLQVKLGSKWKIDMPIDLTANYNFIETELVKPSVDDQSQRLSGWKLVPSINPSTSWTSADRKFYASMGIKMKVLGMNYLSHYNDKRTAMAELFAEPHLSLRYTFSATSELKLSSDFNNAAGDIMDLLTTPVQTDYRNTATASGVIGRSQKWSTDLRYTKQVPLSYFTLAATANYNRGKRNVLTSRIISQTTTESTAIFQDSHTQSANGGINVSKNILPIFTKLSADANVSWSSSEYMMQNSLVTSYRTGYALHLKAEVTPVPWLELNINGNYGKDFLRTESAKESSNSSSDNLRCTGSLAVFPVSAIEIRGTYNFLHNMLESGKYKNASMLSASVQYKTKWAVWRLTGDNLLNVRRYTSTSFIDTDRFVYSTNLVGRTVMLTCKLLLANKSS